LKKKKIVKISNRFNPLQEKAGSGEERDETQPSTEKPPPIYIRERCSDVLVEILKNTAGKNFFVVPLRRGAIEETKIQLSDVPTYRKVIETLDKMSKHYYTYQLKSAKGITAVIKGIESSVDPIEIKKDLEGQGLEIKNVFNIFNRHKIPQPMFKVELMPSGKKIKQGQEHPIYKVRYVLYRRVTIEEPLKRRSVIQCFKCQEYGHSKSYCKLNDVCVICGNLHETKSCILDKTIDDSKK